MNRPHPARVLLCLAAVAVFGAGCETTARQSTRLRASDFDHTVSEIVEKIRQSQFLRDRTPESPKVRVVINKVENLTDDIIPPAEQWALMARIRSGLSIDVLRKQKNIVFMIAPERHAGLIRSGFKEDLGPKEDPTHVLKAVFRSSVRVDRDGKERVVKSRTDYYFLEFMLTEVQTRAEAWVDFVEFKRAAAGLAID